MWKSNIGGVIVGIALVAIVVAVVYLSHHGHNPNNVQLPKGK
jgi:hypothetical protein